MDAASSHHSPATSPLKRGLALLASFLLGVAVTTLAHRISWGAQEETIDAEVAQAEPAAHARPAAKPSAKQATDRTQDFVGAPSSQREVAKDTSALAQTDAAASSGAKRAERAEPKEEAASSPEPAASESEGRAAAGLHDSREAPEKTDKTSASQRAKNRKAQAEPQRLEARQERATENASTARAQEPVAAEAIPDENDMDRLLDQALEGADRGGSGGTEAAEELSRVPSKQEIEKAVSVLFPAIQGCARGKSGMAVVDLVVRNDGRVVSAKVSGHPFEGSAAGRCIAGVMRRARFPRFAKPSFRVRYPLSIRP